MATGLSVDVGTVGQRAWGQRATLPRTLVATTTSLLFLALSCQTLSSRLTVLRVSSFQMHTTGEDEHRVETLMGMYRSMGRRIEVDQVQEHPSPSGWRNSSTTESERYVGQWLESFPALWLLVISSLELAVRD